MKNVFLPKRLAQQANKTPFYPCQQVALNQNFYALITKL